MDRTGLLRRGGWLFAGLALLLPHAAVSDTVVGGRVFESGDHRNGRSLFLTPGEEGTPGRSLRQDLYLKHQGQGLGFQGTARLSLEEGKEARADLLANELYWDTSWRGIDLSLGRKVTTWGVGYAFRPLDVVQRQDRRATDRRDLVGVPLASATWLARDEALTLAYLNRLRLQGDRADASPNELAFKLYRLLGSWDTHTVVHAGRGQGVRVGEGLAGTFGEGLEVHGEALYASRCKRGINRLTREGGILAGDDPWEREGVGPCGKLLAGLSWTGASRLTLLFEAWHDGEAYSRGQWEELRDLARAQRGLLGDPGVPREAVERNLTASLRFYEQPMLLRNNLFFRFSRDGDRLDPALDVLLTPEDGGRVATASADYELSQNLRLFGGARWLGGRPGSAYREAPVDWTAFAGIEGEFAP